MNWIIFCSFRLKMTFWRNNGMQLHTNIGNLIFLICAWFMVMKVRMEDQVVWTWKWRSTIMPFGWEFEIQEALEERPWVVKTNVGTEKDKDYNWIECIDTTLQIVPEIMRSSFWRIFELLEEERMAMKFAERKWLLRKVWQNIYFACQIGV